MDQVHKSNRLLEDLHVGGYAHHRSHKLSKTQKFPVGIALRSIQMEPVVEELVKLTVSWSGRQLEIALGATLTVAHLKMQLQQLTNVLVSRQKIMGLTVAGKPAPDSVRLALNSTPLRLGAIIFHLRFDLSSSCYLF